ncbi:MAG: riboflavin synthase [Rhodospirillaceae bacterium]|nr:riboflavin synthase [Rhodospirillaceae bacterium]MBT3925790.1 riboflavin synthase [Rhodospirillaceae bacterium]MBT5675717.1 riboflavin synthase [Rhodospirillaceae bacterium]MBT5778750.1 riboflavin synthase [Rhodospirillaceae bacterium]MBT7292686.1 riboflavin synthase [Rhodospirillaceae bacterium]
MFTGIITDLGRVREIRQTTDGDDRRILIETAYDTAGIALGASIACAGPCLTVVETGPNWFAVDVSGETMARTTIGGWQAGSRINLERALSIGDELGGHLVTGHIDGVGQLQARRDDGESVRMEFAAPAGLMKFIAGKGSISIDGVSLTVNEVGPDSFGVNIIPHTLSVTTLGEMAPGAAVNLEIDLLARYVARLTEEV